MKKVLVTGAAGAVGSVVIKFLLSEGKYEITALDLKNGNSHRILKRYKNRVNIIYGDVCDRILMEALIKDHDVIIHLASVLPPLSILKKDLTEVIEYDTVENIVRSINYYNPSCHLIYASSTSIYTNDDKITVKTKTKHSRDNYFDYYKNKSETLIKNRVKNYTIIRVPLVLSNPATENFIYNVTKEDAVQVITKEDAAYAFVKTIDNLSELRKKTVNISGNDKFTMTYKTLLSDIIKNSGLWYKLILSDIFIEKTYTSPVCSDIKKYEEILKYQTDTYSNYLDRLKYNNKNKRIRKLLGKIYISIRGLK